MSTKNREIVENANVLLAQGKNEEFLLLCQEDVKWTILADTPSTMKGREAIRTFMASYSKDGAEPPKFTVRNLIAEGDVVMSNGDTSMQNNDGVTVPYAYCDVYQFHDGKIAELLTFMNRTQAETNKEHSASA